MLKNEAIPDILDQVTIGETMVMIAIIAINIAVHQIVPMKAHELTVNQHQLQLETRIATIKVVIINLNVNQRTRRRKIRKIRKMPKIKNRLKILKFNYKQQEQEVNLYTALLSYHFLITLDLLFTRKNSW